MNEVARRIEVLNGSLRCFILGWLSLVPLFGLFFTVRTLVVFWKTRKQLLDSPNLAWAYLWSGLALAAIGLLLTVVIVLAATVNVANAIVQGWL